jgi:poly(A) polymerase/tRNA nucleotidyltransferase (CCA-adding enzyme)
MKFNIPEHVSRVTNILIDAGYEAYLVGGCVRDLIMGKIPKDYDLTTNAKPEQIISAFEAANGEEEIYKIVYENVFGTVMIIDEEQALDSVTRQIEITPYRLETTYSDNRHPDSVSFSDTIEEDLKRRDFTINAMAYDPSKGHLKDIFGGINDISKRQIVCVGNPTERFTEDALRIMRAIRFSAQLGFAVSHETMDAMFHVKRLLKNVSIERIRDEFVKIINSPNPTIGIGLMVQLGIMEFVIPELLEGIKCDQGGAHKYDVFEHLLHACQHAADKGFPFHVKLAALFHDIGKPRTRRPGAKKEWTFYGHEVVGAKMAEKIMLRMKFPKSDIEPVVKLVRYHMFFSDVAQITLSAVRRIIRNVGTDHIWDLMKIRECDRVGMDKRESPYRLRQYHVMIEKCLRDPISVSQLKVDGNYLMKELHVKPGRRMGWILHALLEEVLEHPENNTVEILSDRVKQLEMRDDSELMKLGEKAKEKKEELEEEEVGKLHVKHGVKK